MYIVQTEAQNTTAAILVQSLIVRLLTAYDWKPSSRYSILLPPTDSSIYWSHHKQATRCKSESELNEHTDLQIKECLHIQYSSQRYFIFTVGSLKRCVSMKAVSMQITNSNELYLANLQKLPQASFFIAWWQYACKQYKPVQKKFYNQ